MKNRVGIVLAAFLAMGAIVIVERLAAPEPGAAPQADQSPEPFAASIIEFEGSPLYRFERLPRSAGQQRYDHGVDLPTDLRVLACDGGIPPDWRPVLHRLDIVVSGVHRSRLGYLERADGRRQLTIDGCPVYRYAGESSRGRIPLRDANGEWSLAKSAITTGRYRR